MVELKLGASQGSGKEKWEYEADLHPVYEFTMGGGRNPLNGWTASGAAWLRDAIDVNRVTGSGDGLHLPEAIVIIAIPLSEVLTCE